MLNRGEIRSKMADSMLFKFTEFIQKYNKITLIVLSDVSKVLLG